MANRIHRQHDTLDLNGASQEQINRHVLTRLAGIEVEVFGDARTPGDHGLAGDRLGARWTFRLVTTIGAVICGIAALVLTVLSIIEKLLK